MNIIIKKKIINQDIKISNIEDNNIINSDESSKHNWIQNAWMRFKNIFAKKEEPQQENDGLGEKSDARNNNDVGFEEFDEIDLHSERDDSDNFENSKLSKEEKYNWFQRLLMKFSTKGDMYSSPSYISYQDASSHSDYQFQSTFTTEAKVNEDLDTEHLQEVISIHGDQDIYLTLNPLTTKEDKFSISTPQLSQEKKSGILNTVVNIFKNIKNFFVGDIEFAQYKYNNDQDVACNDVNERVINNQKPVNAKSILKQIIITNQHAILY